MRSTSPRSWRRTRNCTTSPTSIATAAERGSDLTRSLLAFARKQPLMPRDIDIGQKIVGMEQLLRRTLGEHIECEFRLDQDLWQASVDPGQLASALLNLVLNARDAMPSGGKLTVEVRNTSLGESDVDVNGEARPGDYVMVAVTDTGTGMTAEVAGRAFEPFFTTKEVGKGTGLGLSMVYGFAQQSGGSMQIRSEPGHGTAVRLFFPRVGDAAGERRAVRRSARHAHRQRNHSRCRGRRHGARLCRKRIEGARLSRHRRRATGPRRSRSCAGPRRSTCCSPMS